MMNKYFLNEELLHSICYFQSANHYLGAPGEHCSVAFEKTMIKDLLTKQPELKIVYDSFLEACEDNECYSSTFPEFFANKILIDNFAEQLLTKHYKCEHDIDRTKAFTRILKNYPPFFNILHNFIKNNPEKSDDTLYGFYFKNLSNDRFTNCNINKEEVISIIDGFDVDKKESFKPKKLNAYLSLEPKDVSLYNHIMENMGDSISNNGKVKAIWEDSIKDFDKESNEQYENKNVFIPLLMEEESYHYMFKINSQYIIEKTKAHEARVDRFNRALHDSISKLVSTEFTHIKRIKENGPSVEFTFSSIEEKVQVKNFCNFILKDVNSIITKVNFINPYEEHQKICDDYLEKAYMAYTLNGELNSNQKTVKIKSKI
jgi:hypothetical protein